MDNKLYKLAAKAVKDVYDGICHNKGQTEWKLTMIDYHNNPLQILAIGGTNEWVDWFWNFLMVFWDGVKYCNYRSAKTILKFQAIDKDIPLLIAVHSKSGGTGEYLTLKLEKEYNILGCVSFCPAPALSKKVKMENTVIFIDPDDKVPLMGGIMFNHPVCEVVMLPNDPGWWIISDHFMNHIIEYLDTLEDEPWENIYPYGIY